MMKAVSKRSGTPAAKALAAALGIALLAGCATVDTNDDTGTGKDGATGGPSTAD